MLFWMDSMLVSLNIMTSYTIPLHIAGFQTFYAASNNSVRNTAVIPYSTVLLNCMPQGVIIFQKGHLLGLNCEVKF